MRFALTPLILVCAALAVAGCRSTRTQISSKAVADGEEGFHSVLDVKIEKYKDLSREFPKEPKYQERLARLYWAREAYRPALKHLKKARKLDPGNSKYYYLEAEIYHGIGNYTLAESAYQDLFRTLPEDKFSGPHKDLAQVYIDAGHYDKAEKELKRCLEIDPQFPFPHYLLGHISLSRGNKKQATRHFETYMKLGGVSRHDEVRQALRNMQPNIFGRRKQFYRGDEVQASEAGSDSQP